MDKKDAILNIVTIDFDIIMAPFIELYNDSVPKKDWDILTSTGIENTIVPDFIHYKRLTEWILSQLKYLKKEDIIIIENHARVNYYLPENKINLYNIDHHHDLGYHLEQENEPLNCGNWVDILDKKNMINNYYWICNSNSNKIFAENKKIQIFDLKNYDLTNIPKPDKLFLCLSIPWIPPNIRNLFFIWVDILNEFYSTKFEIDFTID